MDKICPICGKTFSTNRKAAIYCSTTCRGEANRNYKTCPVCGRRFGCAPSSDVRCCSRECSATHRREILATQANYACIRGESLAQIRSEFASAHQGVAHQSAKTYLLQGPDGRTHEVTNLANWVRECGCFENPRSALRALHRTKPESCEKKQRSDYRGWAIIAIIGQNSPGKQRPPRHCKVCGKVLPATKRSYCSPECYNASRRKGRDSKSE